MGRSSDIVAGITRGGGPASRLQSRHLRRGLAVTALVACSATAAACSSSGGGTASPSASPMRRSRWATCSR